MIVTDFRPTGLRFSFVICNRNTGLPLPTHLEIGSNYACIRYVNGYNVPQAKPRSAKSLVMHGVKAERMMTYKVGLVDTPDG